jgi:hypothetical protein
MAAPPFAFFLGPPPWLILAEPSFAALQKAHR